MQTLITIACLLALAGLALFLARGLNKDENKQQRVPDELWERAKASTDDQLTKVLLDLSRPLSGLPSVYDLTKTPLYNSMQQKLLAAGGAFGGSPEVFFAVQAACTVGGFALLLLTFAGFLPTFLGGIFAATLTYLPYGQVSGKAKKRGDEVTSGLPDFAELLQMPLTAGLSVLAALDFTAKRTFGPVSDEVNNMLALIRARALEETDAFNLAGERLGTPEARNFFQALSQAHVEGAKVIGTLGKQAEALRDAAFQAQRARLKRLPIKLILLIFAHFIPFVFILVAIQFLAGFEGM